MPAQTQFRQLFRRITTRSGALVFDPKTDQVSASQTDPRSEWINKLLPSGVAGKSIVEVGCWTGVTLRDLARFGATRCVGIDIDGPWLAAARQAFPAGEIIAISDISKTPSSLSSSFDIALLLETLEHLPKGTELMALEALKSLLKPQGVAIISTPASGLSRLFDPAWLLTGHRHYSSRALKNLLEYAGFHVEFVGYSGSTKDAISTLHHYINKYLYTPVPRNNTIYSHQEDFTVGHKRSILSQSIWAVANVTHQDR